MNNVAKVNKIYDDFKISRYEKPSLTLEVDLYKYIGNERIKIDKQSSATEEQKVKELFRISGLFSRIVSWRKTSDVLISIELTQRSDRNMVWKGASELTMYLVPNYYTTWYDMDVTVFDDLHKSIKEYEYTDNFFTIEHLVMLPFMFFSGTEDVDIKVRENLYNALIMQLKKDHVGGYSKFTLDYEQTR